MDFDPSEDHRMVKALVARFVRDELLPLEAGVLTREAHSTPTAVTGVVRLEPGAIFDEAAVKSHVRDRLAGYKTPKAIYPADIPLRASNGKADYATVRDFAVRQSQAA